MISLRTFYSSPHNKHSLVLIHAFPLTSSMWDEAARTIAEHAPAFNIILADLPGFGDASPESEWTIGAAATELYHELRRHGVTEAVIAGLSMGGYVALAYYRLYFNDVKALILSNTRAGADTEEAKKGRADLAKEVLSRGHEAIYDAMLAKLVSDPAKRKDPELLPKLKKWISSSSPEAIASCLRALALRDDSTDLLETISCPTLLITGEDDGLISFEEMEKMSPQIRGAKFISFMKGGHLTAVEDPGKWGSVVASFLNVL